MATKYNRAPIITVMACLAVLAYTWAKSAAPSSVADVREQIIKNFRATRPFEGLIVGIGYRPFHPYNLNDAFMFRAVRRDIERFGKSKGEEQATYLGTSALLEALGGDLDSAIRRASSLVPSRSWLLSDLSAFLLERFRLKGEPVDLIRSLDAASRARRFKISVVEADFNHAITAQKLSLAHVAKMSSTKYVKDSGSGWEGEFLSAAAPLEFTAEKKWESHKSYLLKVPRSRSYLAAFTVVREFPLAAREFAERDLLGLWALELGKNNSRKARQLLNLARDVGDCLRTFSGDYTISDSVAVADDAFWGKRNVATKSIVSGHALYREAWALYDNRAIADARLSFKAAAFHLQAVGSPLGAWSSFWIAVCEIRMFHYQEAERTLRGLLGNPLIGRYPSLVGNIYWSLGLILAVQGDPLGALAQFEKAIVKFDQVKDRESVAVMESLVAESMRKLGDMTTAASYLVSALRVVPQMRDPRRRYMILVEGVEFSKDLGLSGAMLDFLDEAFKNIPKSEPVLTITGARRKAQVLSGLGMNAQASDVLDGVWPAIVAVKDLDTRQALIGDLMAVEGQINAIERPWRSIESLSKAMAIYSRTRYKQQLSEIGFQRSRAYMKLGEFGLAITDLEFAINAFRATVDFKNPVLETNYAKIRELFDAMANAQILRRNPAEALSYVEIGRQWITTELPPASTSLTARATLMAEVQRNLPENAVLIEFLFLEDTGYAWLVRRASIDMISLGGAGRSQIDNLISTLRESIASGRSLAGFRQVSSDLFEVMVRPISSQLLPGELLILVPDLTVSAIPFSALWDKSSERYLIQDHPVSVCPSAGTYLAANRRRQSLPRRPPSDVFAIGSPYLDRGIWANLSSLRYAEEEVRAVASVYPRAHIFLGREATKSTFLSSSSRHEVIHIASHAMVNGAHPSLSSILFSSRKETADSGMVYTSDIKKLSFNHTRLVVLSACGSAGASPAAGGSVSSIAQPFLLRGVPSVIGSLWRVGDRQSLVFSKRLHLWLQRGLEPVSALQAVQVEFINNKPSQDGTPTWAAFVALGA